jgi:hypothetical protein
MGGDARGFAVVAIVGRIIGGIDQWHAGAELDGTVEYVDRACRTRVGPDGHAVDVQSVHVHRLNLNGFDGHLGPARRRGQHRWRAHQ